MKRHVLYRMFDAEGELLYIGLTNNPASRFYDHRSDKQWWNQVANVGIENFGSREELKAAEKAAIAAEQPRYNKTGRDRNIAAEVEFQAEEDFQDDCMGEALAKLAADINAGREPEDRAKAYMHYVNEAARQGRSA